MKHLTVLERAGLITVRRQGRERWNHLNAATLGRIYDRWLSRQAAWSPTLEGRHITEEESPVLPTMSEQESAIPCEPKSDSEFPQEPLKELYLVVRPEEKYMV